MYALSWFATFVLGQKIIEVKTSKKPSKDELLQAIAYLLAQSKENKRNYGKVESVTIFMLSITNQ
jgi:hypothetical protein